MEQDRRIGGIIGRKAFVDERNRATVEGRAKRFERRLLLAWTFLGRPVRRIRPAKFFWGAVLGNGASFLFRRDIAVAMGGFDPEEFPASDYCFFARFSKRHDLRQHRATCARVRVFDNETARPETVRLGLKWGSRLQKALIGTEVPFWCSCLLPLLLARHLAEFRQFWRGGVDTATIESAVGMLLPRDRRVLLRLMQLLLRGF